MEIPEIQEADDREKLAKIASEPIPESSRFAVGESGKISVNDMLKRLDKDADGKITKGEAAGIAPIDSKFEQIDSNKDGGLDIGELARAMQSMRPAGAGAGQPGTTSQSDAARVPGSELGGAAGRAPSGPPSGGQPSGGRRPSMAQGDVYKRQGIR